jgi:hypothetical protein
LDWQSLYGLPSSRWISETSGTSGDLTAIWGSSAGELYAVGRTQDAKGLIMFSAGDGSWVQQFQGSMPLLAIWGSDGHDIYAAGALGTILHSTGDGSWSPEVSNTPASDLIAVWGSSRTDVYAASTGTLLHSMGDGAWAKTSGFPGLRAIWGSGPDDAYLVGANGLIDHQMGSLFEQETSGVSVPLEAIWGRSSGDIFAAGAMGVVLHSSGQGVWVKEQMTANSVLRSIAGSARDTYVVGDRVLHRFGSGLWTTELSMVSLNGVWGDAQSIHAVGDGGVILRRSP